MTRRIQLLTLASAVVLGGCAVWGPERPPERNAALRLEQGLAALEQGLYREAFDDLRWVYTECVGREAGYHALAALAAIELDPRNGAGRPAVGSDLLARVIQDPATPAWSRPMAETTYLLGLALGAPPVGQPATANDADTANGAPQSDSDNGDGGHGAGGTAAGTAVVAASTADAADTTVVPDTTDAPVAAPPPAKAAAPGPVPVPEAGTGQAYGCGALLNGSPERPYDLPVLPGPSLMAILAETETQRDILQGRADSLSARLAATRRELEETRNELERIRKTLKP
jgi:hypothetical protein